MGEASKGPEGSGRSEERARGMGEASKGLEGSGRNEQRARGMGEVSKGIKGRGLGCRRPLADLVETQVGTCSSSQGQWEGFGVAGFQICSYLWRFVHFFTSHTGKVET